MNKLVRPVHSPCESARRVDPQLAREWLVTNGLGGYASGSVCGPATRRYHGLLVAAHPAPLGRIMMLDRLDERLSTAPGTTHVFVPEAGSEGQTTGAAAGPLIEFRLEAGLPVWVYQFDHVTIEKRLVLTHHQNTVYMSYRVLQGDDSLTLILRPLVHFRGHDAPLNSPHPGPYQLIASEDRYEIRSGRELPHLRLNLHGRDAAFVLDAVTSPEMVYRVEQRRGYEASGKLWSPGYFRVSLARDSEVTLVASTEPWENLLALSPAEAARAERSRRARLLSVARLPEGDTTAAELTLAADQFLITPAGRVEDATRARAAGEEVRTVIAGYHWFTDWGRDTMISLEGLTLATGRHVEAGYILRTFAHYIRDGLIPNLFPEGRTQGLYHTADATLWFFHAIERYVAATADVSTLELLLPQLFDIVRHHVRGTHFGIGVDPEDGLLRQGEKGYQLTWMDAKVGDWVVTPRRGKAVETNALWYNALRLLENWAVQFGRDAEGRALGEQAEEARRSFNRRFWYDAGGYLYDVVDGENGDDPACRPNQVLAISLTHPVLDESRWEPVLGVVSERLLTPFGLRSLAPGHPDYKAKYDGDLRARDAAYHQGTVWAWLIGPFIDAWLKVHGDRAAARRFLSGLIAHLNDAGLGTISEIFDAEPPYTPRGCVAQAWSIAEVLRCWIKTRD